MVFFTIFRPFELEYEKNSWEQFLWQLASTSLRAQISGFRGKFSIKDKRPKVKLASVAPILSIVVQKIHEKAIKSLPETKI